MPTSISLIIPTYNRADLICETIDSALSQDEPFEEIIVIDDGSTDNTEQVLGSYGSLIRLIRTPNCGVQTARNLGVKTATSEYVTFCDSDDLLEPGFVAKIKNHLAQNIERDAIYINIRKFSDKSIDSDDFSQAPAEFFSGAKLEGDFFSDIPDLYLKLFTVHPFYIVGCTVKKSFFDTIGGFDPRFRGVGAEDGEFTLRAASLGKIEFCKIPLAKVRRHAGNDSANAINMMLGSASILEYASKHHLSAVQYRSALIRSAHDLRIDVADRLFAKGEFDIARPMFQQIYYFPVGTKFYLKKIILSLPNPFKTIFWKITQAR